jgi:hypothetical protein
MISKSGRWDAAAWGAPVNQYDSVRTSLLFSVILLEGLRQLGVHVSEAESDAYMQLWRWSGWLMGIDPELLPASEAEGIRLEELLDATQGPPDDDSRRLTRALLESGRLPTLTAEEQKNLERLEGFSFAVCRRLVGDDIADVLGVGAAGAWKHVVPVATRLVSGIERLRSRVPFANDYALRAGVRYWEQLVAAEAGLAGIAELALPSKLATA